MKPSRLKYYLASIPTIIRDLDFFSIPFLLIRRPVKLRLKNGLKFYVENFMDVWIIKEVVLDNQYQLTKKMSQAIVDIGAGIGDFSILASRVSKQVYSFEKDKNRVEIMKKNIKLNDRNNIIISQRTAKSLDEIFNNFRIKKCDLLKVDCEGCEYRIFENTSKSTLDKIFRIVMEVHLFNAKQKLKYSVLKKRLKSNGFLLREIKNPVHESLLLLFAESIRT